MLVDIIIVLVGIAALFTGFRQGFITGLGTAAGFVVGWILGRLLSPLVESLSEGTSAMDNPGVVMLLASMPLVLSVLFAFAGSGIGAWIKKSMDSELGQGIDAIGGTVTGGIVCVLVIWLAAGFIRTTPWVEPNRWVADSTIIAAVDRTIPYSSQLALGDISQGLKATGFPQVFSGQTEQIRGVGEPDSAMVDVGRKVEDSVVKITTTATTCPAGSEGSGFVYRDGLVATNAHVVAGSTELAVQVGGKGRPYAAEVVEFDEQADVAVLRVPELSAPALDFGDGLATGDDSVVVGFPANGPYTISPSRVRDKIDARGLDIYDENSVVREVYSLRGIVREGNSGGPLIDANGDVVGMVFARSATDGETGYALTRAEIADELEAGANTNTPQPTGQCTS
ncbi:MULTISPECIES: MarP family serine protease [unclassified Brevibacterium]|uniref:MarP family serine protease n=1 Tax=unclassified Brevibacterium TaxID=2614124 RepID=UPI001E327583|nr:MULTISPECIES: MarP family serine protease [unclassified Brevibacterium]MCD1287364.1 serine protease [Brevibacterium sp. CCUG 69071]MDK8436842.1 MarP family serine protease [Brevibacterium sp. H-BE7]